MTAKKLVFIDERSDLGKFPNLMSMGGRTFRLKLTATTPATFGLANDHLGALFAGNQLSRVSLVTLLAPCLRLVPGDDFRFGLAWGYSVLGGSEELRGVSFCTWSVNVSTCLVNRSI